MESELSVASVFFCRISFPDLTSFSVELNSLAISTSIVKSHVPKVIVGIVASMVNSHWHLPSGIDLIT